MQTIWNQIKPWIEAAEPFALATVVKAKRSTPRGQGATLAINGQGDFVGSVSAGCVETSVIENALETIADGKVRWVSVGQGHGFPWEISLSCGGQITVRIEKFFGQGESAHSSAVINAIDALVQSNEAGVLVCRDNEAGIYRPSGEGLGDLLSKYPSIVDFADKCIKEDGLAGELDIDGVPTLFQPIKKRPRLFVVGADAISTHLTSIARDLQLEIIVIDPRSAYARSERFYKQPARIHCAWPSEVLAEYSIESRDFAVTLTHDPKIDTPALKIFLESDCHYIGALGSRRTHETRVKRLIGEGLSEESVKRIRGPIGLDIGSQTPMEIAVSIAGQIIQARSQERSAFAE